MLKPRVGTALSFANSSLECELVVLTGFLNTATAKQKYAFLSR